MNLKTINNDCRINKNCNPRFKKAFAPFALWNKIFFNGVHPPHTMQEMLAYIDWESGQSNNFLDNLAQNGWPRSENFSIATNDDGIGMMTRVTPSPRCWCP